MANMKQKNITIIGAGVSGLTTALLLSKCLDKSGRKYSITVCAKHMPGDYDIEYASPWAGADYLPFSEEGTDAAEYDRKTWPYLRDLARDHPESGVHFQQTTRYIRHCDADKFPLEPWWKELFPDYNHLPTFELPPGMARASTFTSVCINTALYLPYLTSLCLATGVTLKRANFTHVSDAAHVSIHSSGKFPDLVVNCTGLSSLKLGGVGDKAMYPVRGQIVLIRNNPGGIFSVSSTDEGPEEGCYGMTRAAGGGMVLGGSRHAHSWDAKVDVALGQRIVRRAVDLWPSIADGEGNVDVVRHAVGLRPEREGGVRVAREVVTWVGEQGEEGKVEVVHNYGHGGAGYQASYGCAERVVGLVGEALRRVEGEDKDGRNGCVVC